MGNLNARNFYFYIRSLDPAVPIYRDREYVRYTFNQICIHGIRTNGKKKAQKDTNQRVYQNIGPEQVR
jgi:hypothetical protein